MDLRGPVANTIRYGGWELSARFALTLNQSRMSDTSSSSSGSGFTGLLAVLFIGLKLTHYIDWSWWWVLSPLWIVAASVLTVLAIFLCAALVSPGVARRVRR